MNEESVMGGRMICGGRFEEVSMVVHIGVEADKGVLVRVNISLEKRGCRHEIWI